MPAPAPAPEPVPEPESESESRDLELELEYLMEDAVVGWQGRRQDSGEDSRDGQGSAPCSMRMGLDDLRSVWGLRVKKRLPLQYISHSAFWRDMVLSVGRGVLIPRPETELMIDFVLEAAEASPRLGRGLWADLGTGSGALALGVARALLEVPTVYAVDVAPEPLAYVSFNAQRYGVGHRVRPIESNWFEGLRHAGIAAGSLAGVVSNPPYIPDDEWDAVEPNVKDHEPALALRGGADGLDLVRPILEGAAPRLRQGGLLLVEVADARAEAGAAIARAQPKLEKVEILVRVADAKNCNMILNELKEYSSDVDMELIAASIKAIGQVVRKIETSAATAA